jgi:hypothetical protein
MKIEITQEQAEQFNQMRSALIKISSGFMPISELEEVAEEEYGLEYLEALEMAYENIQDLARRTAHGTKSIKIKQT